MIWLLISVVLLIVLIFFRIDILLNTYGGAELFDVSQYGVVADYAAIIPAIIEEIKARKES